MKKIILFSSIILMIGLFFANVYNSIVDVPNWCNDIPNSIKNLRNYYVISNPGNFYRIFSPINQIVALIVFIIFWKSNKKARIFFGLALILTIAVDAFTFAYFFPRNDLLFSTNIDEIEKLKNVCEEWKNMNWVRSSIVFLGVVFQFLGLNKIIDTA